MSYAEAAASSGPSGAQKLPTPPKVKHTTDPSGSVETVNEHEFQHLKDQAKEEVWEQIEKNKERSKKISKELGELEDEGKTLYHQAVAQLKEYASQVSSYFNQYTSQVQSNTSTVVQRTTLELQNPVVVAQAVVGITGALAGYFAYLERKRINTDNKLVLGIHTAVVTGLVLADGYLFSTYYPKYDKKPVV